MIKLVVSDIDGTLVPDGTDRIDPEMMDVVRQLTEHGIVFADLVVKRALGIMHPALNVILIIDFVDFLPEGVLKVAVDLQQLQRREQLAIKVHHFNCEERDHHRLYEKQKSVSPGELPKIAKLASNSTGEKNF